MRPPVNPAAALLALRVRSWTTRTTRDFVKRHGEFSIVKPETVIAALGERAADFQRAVLVSARGF